MAMITLNIYVIYLPKWKLVFVGRRNRCIFRGYFLQNYLNLWYSDNR